MFEYKAENLSAFDIEKQLNELGKDGWELVSGYLSPENYLVFVAILKRAFYVQ